MQAKSEELVTADVPKVSGWREEDPTVFEMTISGRLQGEFQVTNGYGPLKAPQVMKVKLTQTHHSSKTSMRLYIII